MIDSTEIKKFESFMDHSVKVWNITQEIANTLVKCLSQKDLDKNYDAIDEFLDIQSREWKHSYNDLDELLEEYYFYQESLEQKEKENFWYDLDDSNLKIEDISDWNILQNWINEPLINPDKDIVEINFWEYDWDQLFSHQAAKRELEKVGKRMAPNPQYYEDMIQNKYNWDYQKFLKEEKIKFTWVFSVAHNKLDLQWEDFYLLTEDGGYFCWNKKDWYIRSSWEYFTSIRCVK